jgi:hypothetical protein
MKTSALRVPTEWIGKPMQHEVNADVVIVSESARE